MRVREYPFTAVAGQGQAKEALLLAAVDPKIGGVLLRGEKGAAKSTLARGLAKLLPDVDGRPAPFRTLPLGAGEDRIVGGLDFEAVLASGRPTLRPGLLAEANGGVLYIDEVNLLDDHLSDLLLDAAAFGRLQVERDGFTAVQEAAVTLIGTMNPEEGRLRPQLLDRFGLCVKVEAEMDEGIRRTIVNRRLAFEDDPETFMVSWRAAEEALARDIRLAREYLPHVEITGTMLREIAQIVRDNRVHGQRAEIALTRACRARAALQRRRFITRDDIRVVSPSALAHRYHPEPPAGEARKREVPEKGRQPRPGPDRDPEASGRRKPVRPGPSVAPPEEVFSVGEPFRVRSFEGLVEATPRIGSGRRTRGPVANRSGRVVRSEPAEEAIDVALADTIKEAALHQKHRRAGRPGLMVIEKRDLRKNVREGRHSNLLVFCVDASGSMGAVRRMEAVKGAVFSLLVDAYQKRDRVSLIAFRKAAAQVLLPPTSSVERANRLLADMASGGRTPLAAGILRAFDLAKSAHRRDPRLSPIVIILSDGRANTALTPGGDPETELAGAALLCRRGFKGRCFVVDSEPPGRIRLGRARTLAGLLEAEYVRLEELKADRMAGWLRREVLGQSGPSATFPLFERG